MPASRQAPVPRPYPTTTRCRRSRSITSPRTKVIQARLPLSMPTFSIDNVTQNEGDSSTTAFTFTVTLSNPSQGTITVDFATQNDSAIQPGDYTPNTGTLNFVNGDTQETIIVLVNGDTTLEPNESFFVNLSNNSSNSLLAPNTKGTGTITNDDNTPSFTIDDVTHDEGNSGTTAYTFTVTK